MKSQGRFQAFVLRLAILQLCLVLASCTVSVGSSAQSAATPQTLAPGLHALGNRIVLSNGKGALTNIIYHGVNRSGAEYVCVQAAQGEGKHGTFDGPVDQASVSAMLAWKITIVRVPLNEDCWLGLNGEPSNGETAQQYRQDVINYVHLLRQNNLVVSLDLHWSAPGSDQAVKQLPMPDLDHTPAFWSSVAATFKNDPFVVFDLYNEPYTMNWFCWQDGSTFTNHRHCTDVGYAVAGMQTLVDTVRQAGAGNLIMLGGLAYANDLWGWAQFKPRDPLNNLAASFHIYPSNGCNSTDCLNNSIAQVASQYPLIAGEVGEFDCTGGFLNDILPWFDSHHIGYMAWAWTTYSCANFPGLLNSYDGNPTGYGAAYKQHLSSL
ncbi:MAG TPA: cellulase family glycosylhydrolase [Ktedonobacteraceae bacterium]